MVYGAQGILTLKVNTHFLETRNLPFLEVFIILNLKLVGV